MNNRVKFVLTIIVGALIVSVIFNLHYYMVLRVNNENVLNTIRAKALATYGGEVSIVKYHLEEYLDTLNFEAVEKKVGWAIYSAKVQADLLKQGLAETSGLMYYELSRTARALENYFVHKYYGPINATKVEIIAQALYVITYTFGGMELTENEDPIEVLGPSNVDEVINNCLQIQQIVHTNGH